MNSGIPSGLTRPLARTGQTKSTLFTATGTFLVPIGVTEVYIEACGGGGGGGGSLDQGGSTSTMGSGGGGGASYVGYMPVAGGSVLSITVGAAGSGGTSGSTTAYFGDDGGDTFVTQDGINRISCSGGTGGKGIGYSTSFGAGAGGGGPTEQEHFAGMFTGGGNGGIGCWTNNTTLYGAPGYGEGVGGCRGGKNGTYAGGGGASLFGRGGDGKHAATGEAGQGYGGGGGGSSTSGASQSSNGGAGSAGFVRLTWTE